MKLTVDVSGAALVSILRESQVDSFPEALVRLIIDAGLKIADDLEARGDLDSREHAELWRTSVTRWEALKQTEREAGTDFYTDDAVMSERRARLLNSGSRCGCEVCQDARKTIKGDGAPAFTGGK